MAPGRILGVRWRPPAAAPVAVQSRCEIERTDICHRAGSVSEGGTFRFSRIVAVVPRHVHVADAANSQAEVDPVRRLLRFSFPRLVELIGYVILENIARGPPRYIRDISEWGQRMVRGYRKPTPACGCPVSPGSLGQRVSHSARSTRRVHPGGHDPPTSMHASAIRGRFSSPIGGGSCDRRVILGGEVNRRHREADQVQSVIEMPAQSTSAPRRCGPTDLRPRSGDGLVGSAPNILAGLPLAISRVQRSLITWVAYTSSRVAAVHTLKSSSTYLRTTRRTAAHAGCHHRGGDADPVTSHGLPQAVSSPSIRLHPLAVDLDYARTPDWR